MPRYDYRCGSCGLVVEIEHGMTEDTSHLYECPACHGGLRKMISRVAGVIFRGGGWGCKS